MNTIDRGSPMGKELTAFGIIVAILLTVANVFLGNINNGIREGQLNDSREDAQIAVLQEQQKATTQQIVALQHSIESLLQSTQALQAQVTYQTEHAK